MQDCSISSALAMEILHPCSEPSVSVWISISESEKKKVWKLPRFWLFFNGEKIYEKKPQHKTFTRVNDAVSLIANFLNEITFSNIIILHSKLKLDAKWSIYHFVLQSWRWNCTFLGRILRGDASHLQAEYSSVLRPRLRRTVQRWRRGVAPLQEGMTSGGYFSHIIIVNT